MKSISNAFLIVTQHLPRDQIQGGYSILRNGLTKDRHKLVLFCSWTCITTDFAEDGTPIITLTGGLIDQATLNGVFARFQDICILLINIFLKNIVNQVEMDLQNDS
jgi:hypothetical protein